LRLYSLEPADVIVGRDVPIQMSDSTVSFNGLKEDAEIS